ncbi:hypothetical protein J4P02_03620 [Pseudomonas sp. NFXW11]|uniref:hypothetical protein n=1 Tax=Pseudomonas sp. NFXW11 TaxID=2819531 RepID=UPI003CEF1401
MGLGRNQLFALQDGLTERFVYSALRLDLAEVVAKNKATYVVADVVVVRGRVITDGHNIDISCRVLHFEDGGVISTNGLDGVPSFQPGVRKESAHADGQDGLDGDAGGVGARAGSVKIAADRVTGFLRITAVGGQGGRPQDGGHGRKGAKGPSGRKAFIKNADEANGGTGLTGGRSGLPGLRGEGGGGGHVLITTSLKLDSLQYQVRNDAGAPGDAAEVGTPGAGGDGGDPGPVYKIIRVPDFPRVQSVSEIQLQGQQPVDGAAEAELDNLLIVAGDVLAASPLRFSYEEVYSHDGNPGTLGATGSTRDAEVSARQVVALGAAGNLEVDDHTPEVFATAFSGTALELISCALEDDYRQAGNDLTSDLRERIAFLLQICERDTSRDPVKMNILARAYSMARKINLGLDFYGYSQERAPLISFDSYANMITKDVLPCVETIEKSFQAYWDAASDKQLQRQQLAGTLASAEGKVLALQMANEALLKDTRDLLATIPGLDYKVAAAEHVLMDARDVLTAAINKKSNGCDLAGTLTAVGTIVAGVSSGGAGFIAAASAGAKLYKDFTDNNDSLATLWDARQLIQDDLTELAGAAGDVASSVEAIQKGISQLQSPPTRIPQFKMEREEFDKVARDFADMPEAAAYREAGYDFLKSVEARNQAILDYNGMLAQLVELQAQAATGKRAAASIQSAISASVDPAEPHIMSVMSRIYLDSLAVAAHMVHAERKALAYLFGKPSAAPLSALNLATIKAAHLFAHQDWLNTKESFQARRNLTREVEVDLQSLVVPSYWAAFKRTKVLSFCIRPDQGKLKHYWKGLPAFRITGVELVLDGAQSADPSIQIHWVLTHAGTELLYRAKAKSVVFSHRAVPIGGFVSVRGDAPLVVPAFTDNELYAGVSPFASWMLVLEDDQELKLDLNQLSAARLKLSGYFIDG